MEQLEDGDPRQVGRFQIVARLGSGGMGRVYLARAANGQQFALKMIHQFVAEDAQFRRRFHREVAAARRVTGPNTAALVDADPDARPPWMATEFVDGPTLTELIERGGPLTQASCVRLASGMAQALISIHGAGLVHRDLKPSNVLMGADGARLIDFGIAQSSDASSVLTMTGLVTGSAGFMSPEQAQAELVTEASDVFALGAVLFFAATGQRAFGEGSLISVTYRVVHADPNLASVRDEGLRALITDCLMKDAARRPTPQQVYDRCPGILDGSWRTARRMAAGPASAALALAGPLDTKTTTPGGRQAAQGPATQSFTPPFAPAQSQPNTPPGSYQPLPPPPGTQPHTPQPYAPTSYTPRPQASSKWADFLDAGWLGELRRRAPRAWLALPIGAVIVLVGGAALAMSLAGDPASGAGDDSTSTQQPALPNGSPTASGLPGDANTGIILPLPTRSGYTGPTTHPYFTTSKPTSTPTSTKTTTKAPTKSSSPKPVTPTGPVITVPPVVPTTTEPPTGGPSDPPTSSPPIDLP
jgi:serine/threonine protein kinase